MKDQEDSRVARGPVPLADLVAALPGAQRRRDAEAVGAPAESTGSPDHRVSPRRARAQREPGRRCGQQESGRAYPGTAHSAEEAPIACPDASPALPEQDGLFGDGDARKRRPRKPRQPATATQRAIGLLSRREHSRKELTRKLVQKGLEAVEVEQAVDSLAQAGWQDDRRFAESLVRARASSGYGPIHIRAELGTHDLPAEVREQAFDEFEGDWLEIASDLVQRRFARIEDPVKRVRKAADFLTRRGFPSDIVRSASRFDADA